MGMYDRSKAPEALVTAENQVLLVMLVAETVAPAIPTEFAPVTVPEIEPLLWAWRVIDESKRMVNGTERFFITTLDLIVRTS